MRHLYFHLLAFAANVAFFRIVGFFDFFPLAIHAVVTFEKPWRFHHLVKEPRLDFFILILLFLSAIIFFPAALLLH